MMWWQSFGGMTRQKKIGHTGTLDPDAEGVPSGLPWKSNQALRNDDRQRKGI